VKIRSYAIAGLLSLLNCQAPAPSQANVQPAPEITAPVDPAQEAEAQLSRMFELMAIYYKAEHPGPANLAFIGEDGQVLSVALHRCAHPSEQYAGGYSDVIPPLTINCSAGPDGKCVPTDKPSKPFEYDETVWQTNPMFSALGFSQDGPHRFHYGVRTINELTGHGRCQFTVQAFADLDNDSVFSTYEGYGAGDVTGVHSADGLFIDTGD
jgi:hypothetical protein